jgi:hypothetical protein
MQGSVNLANLGLLEFRLAWGLGAGQKADSVFFTQFKFHENLLFEFID